MIELRLTGRLLTPLITKFPRSTRFNFLGGKLRITRPRRRHISKLRVGEPMFPYAYIGYLGELEYVYKCSSKKQAEKKVEFLLDIDTIGLYTSEGMGRIKWLHWGINQYNSKPFSHWKRKVRIRKGLPHYLPPEVQTLIQMALLHDFFHTANHRSKIYIEPEIQDEMLINKLRSHHNNIEDKYINFLQYYDRIAASITRPHYKSPRLDRYNWQSTRKVDFKGLADKIAEVRQKGVWLLYKFTYANDELNQLNESLEHGHTSLKRHLLLMSNLIVQDFLHNRIKSLYNESE
ncbi:MAG: hypothetical protein ACFFFH_15500 [Candidatus Thorarchaeota archaeon]